MATSEIRLYDLPDGYRKSVCAFLGCGKPITFVPGKHPGSRVPVSLTHPDAKIVNGKVVAAPNHLPECPGANPFGRRKRR